MRGFRTPSGSCGTARTFLPSRIALQTYAEHLLFFAACHRTNACLIGGAHSSEQQSMGMSVIGISASFYHAVQDSDLSVLTKQPLLEYRYLLSCCEVMCIT